MKVGEKVSNTEVVTSIVILTLNKLEYTMDCIQSIREYTRNVQYEIIVVDNGSTDGTREWLLTQKDIISILNDKNVGFPSGCNQGIEIAKGKTVMLLNNDVIVTENWLANLLNCLYSSEEIGAVGPITNSASYYQAVTANYSTIIEMHNFAKEYHEANKGEWEQRLKLIGFCMLIKKEVINKIGMLDEVFTPGHYEDDDYSYRMMQAGFKLMLCKDVFIHHYGHITFNDQGTPSSPIIRANREKFNKKWGFDSIYSSYIRGDVISLINTEDKDARIKVLEIGCACGGTLLGIKNKYRNAELYGIELNPNSAAIASLFATVSASNIEKEMDFEEEFFDYIIFPDVLEHLVEPWLVLANMKKYLKPNGKVLSSIPNIMHHSVIRGLLNGRWEYEDAGLLDRTHLRFFTAFEIKKMFENAGYQKIEFSTNMPATSTEDEAFIDGISRLGNPELATQYRVYQYLVRAVKDDNYNLLYSLIASIDQKLDYKNELSSIINFVATNQITCADIIQVINERSMNKQDSLNLLSCIFYEEGLHDHVLPLLSHSLSIDDTHRDTLFNLGYFLYKANAVDLAINYLQQIEEKDNTTKELLNLLSRS
ncbi:N-glycosyltransferase [compost metagenome]